MVALAKHSKRPIFFGETRRFCCCFPLRTELNLSNAGLVPCGPDGKSHALSFGGESEIPKNRTGAPCVQRWSRIGWMGSNPITKNNRNIIGRWWFQIFYVHPENWGRWTQFDYSNIFQLGWFNHQLYSIGVISPFQNGHTNRILREYLGWKMRWWWIHSLGQ